MSLSVVKKQRLAKWVSALRSGKFKKGIGKLKQGDKSLTYCCLGVAREIFPDNIKQRKGEELLNKSSCKFLGINNVDQMDLADMNDTSFPRKTFRGIANYIEERFIYEG